MLERKQGLKMGRAGSKRTAILQGVDRSVFVSPLHMVIPLEFDQVE